MVIYVVNFLRIEILVNKTVGKGDNPYDNPANLGGFGQPDGACR